MVEFKRIGLIVRKDAISPFQDLKTLVGLYKDMAECILSGDKIYWLTVLNGKGEWQIEQLAIEVIAKAFSGG
jgi:hypothetical protein